MISEGVYNGELKIVYIKDSAVLIVIKRDIVTEVLLNPIIRTRTLYFRHSYQRTLDHMYSVLHDFRA
jgi:hypothetical protein